jgi:nucleoside-diphosphate-sugar epimerase
MSRGLIFLTGGSGMIGFKVLLLALEAGYSVRAAVRSEAKRDLILTNETIKRLNPGSSLTFEIIKDMSAPDAYDQALDGADYIIHVASPIPLKGEIKPEDFKSLFVDTAVAGNKAILKAASKTSTIKRLVITSSTSAMLPWSAFTTGSGEVYNEDSRTPFPEGPYANDFEAYNAGKVAALEVIEKYVAENKPSFDVVNVAPSFVIGKSELVTASEDITLGTNVAAIGAVFGNKNPYPNVSITAHIDDVALLHVRALEPRVPSNSLWLAVSGGPEGTTWNDALKFAATRYPKAIAAGVFPNNGDQPTILSRVDSSRTRNFFNMNFKDFESQVTSVLDHFLELKGLPIA